MREHWGRWLTIFIVILLIIIGGSVWWFSTRTAASSAKTGPAKSAPAASVLVSPPAFEDIVLEVDPVKYQETCLAAGGTEAECQATLDDLKL